MRERWRRGANVFAARASPFHRAQKVSRTRASFLAFRGMRKGFPRRAKWFSAVREVLQSARDLLKQRGNHRGLAQARVARHSSKTGYTGRGSEVVQNLSTFQNLSSIRKVHVLPGRESILSFFRGRLGRDSLVGPWRNQKRLVFRDSAFKSCYFSDQCTLRSSKI